jgi:hypothetical protein
MRKKGVRFLLIFGVLSGLALCISGPRISRADDDLSASLIGSWRGTRHAPGTSAVRHNLICFMSGGSVIGAGSSAYTTGASFGNGTFMETTFIGTWVSEGHGNFVAHLISNIQDASPGRATPLGTENLTYRFHMENGKNGKELKGTLEGVFLNMEGNTLARVPSGLTWEAVPLTITSNGYN